VLDGPSGFQPPYESVLKRLAQAKTDLEHSWWIGVPLRKQAWVEGLEAYAMMTWLDDAVGAILNKLDACGLAENTAVILASDHGEHGKRTCNHVPIPCIVRWPGVTRRGSVCGDLVGTVDLAPTVLDVCGAMELAEPMDGRSVKPLLQENCHRWPSNLYMEMGYARAVLTRDWHYIAVRFPEQISRDIPSGDRRLVDQNGWPSAGLDYKEPERFPAYFDADQLHDLGKDPDQQVNLATDASAQLTQMKGLLGQHVARLGLCFGDIGQVV
jgi:arylsulfatase A-like enzyme